MTPIQIVPYDPAWPDDFARVEAELRKALEEVDVVAIEHVGSTSVPGLAAKPVIDVDVVVEAQGVASAISALGAAGYSYEGMRGILDRHAVRAPETAAPPRHVYVVVEGSVALRNHVALRDVLSGDEDLRDRYAAVKRELAGQQLDAENYGASKSGIIDEILARGGLSGPERVAIRSGNESIAACRRADDEVIADDGKTLWVEESGAAGSPSVVLCHGGPGSADHLEELRDLLVDAGLRVIRWDQRGAGRSTPEGPFTVDRFVADLESVRRAVVGGRCWLVGHSWGANLALAHAQLYSRELLGVVYMCGTGLEWWPDFARRHKEIQVERLGSELGSRLVETRGRKGNSREDNEYRLLCLRSELADIHDIDLARRIHQGERRFPVNEAVNAAINSELKGWNLALQRSRCLGVTVPVLVVTGEADPRPAQAVDSLLSALNGATRVTVGGAGHWPWLEQGQQTGRILEGFLTGSVLPEVSRLEPAGGEGPVRS